MLIKSWKMITFGAANTTPLDDTGMKVWTLLWSELWFDRFHSLLLFLGEVRSICESIGSDGSSATVQAGSSGQRPRMDIACVIDATQTTNLSHRKRALEEVRLASELVNANLHYITVRIFYTLSLLELLDKKEKHSFSAYRPLGIPKQQPFCRRIKKNFPSNFTSVKW